LMEQKADPQLAWAVALRASKPTAANACRSRMEEVSGKVDRRGVLGSVWCTVVSG
jgi:hypothetical protein